MPRFALDGQIASQPEAVRDVLARIEAPALDPERPVIFAGIGTSLHACRAAAAWTAIMSEGRLRPPALESHELALTGPLRPEDQLVVVTHRGTKRYPNALLARAADVGARTVTITGMGAAEVAGDVVLRTCPDERSGTHTVSYLCALTVLGRIVARLVGPRGAELEAALSAVPEALERALALDAPIAVAERLQNRAPILVAGYGLDAITASETALKIKEAAYIWAEGMSVEQALHGPVAVYQEPAAAILIDPAADDGGRMRGLHEVFDILGLPAFRSGPGASFELPFPDVPALVRPLVGVVPLQRLAAELARLRGTNPDSIRAHEEPWASAMRRVKL